MRGRPSLGKENRPGASWVCRHPACRIITVSHLVVSYDSRILYEDIILRNSLSTSIYLVLVVVAITTRIWDIPYSREFGVALTVAFLVLEISRTPRLQRTVGLLIGGLGAAAAFAGGNVGPALFDALERAQVFMVMFFAVMWLREPAVTSPSLHNLRDAVVHQPPGRRYPILWLSSHILGAILNIASMSLLSIMAAEARDNRLKRRLAKALMLGFTTASSWGPFYVSVSVILSAIPSVSYTDIAPLGIALSVFMLAVGWAYDRVFLRQPGGGTARADIIPLTAGTVGMAGLILLQLAVLVLGTHELAGVSIPISLGIIGPPFAIIWMFIQGGGQAARALVGRIFQNVPDLRNEAVAFGAASIFGVGVAQILPPELIADHLQAWGLGADFVIVAVIVGMTAASVCGLHPVILVILVGEVLPPEMIGVPAPVLAIALLGVWGTSTMVSPFSATTLFMSRVLNVPSHIIAWRWNIPLVVLTTSVVALYVVALRHLFY